jgi:hypothetical protein
MLTLSESSVNHSSWFGKEIRDVYKRMGRIRSFANIDSKNIIGSQMRTTKVSLQGQIDNKEIRTRLKAIELKVVGTEIYTECEERHKILNVGDNEKWNIKTHSQQKV